MNKRELIELKERIEKDEKKLTMEQGALEQMLLDLQNMGIDSLAAAESKVEEYDEQIADLKEQLKEKIKVVAEVMDGNC
jgi:hypothetical protein